MSGVSTCTISSVKNIKNIKIIRSDRGEPRLCYSMLLYATVCNAMLLGDRVKGGVPYRPELQ